MKTWGLILLLCSFVQTNPPAKIESFSIKLSSGFRREPAKLRADITNTGDKPINTIEFQFDVFDSIRRVSKERLFLKIEDRGLGDRSIKPSKSGTFYNDELGDLKFPNGCEINTYVFHNAPCVTNIKINVIHFKDGSTWERPGWKDEPNPNKNK